MERFGIMISKFRSLNAVRWFGVSLAFLCHTVQAQIMTNFPPSGDLPQIQLQVERTDHGKVRLQWNTVPGVWYDLLFKTNLTDSQWAAVALVEAKVELSSSETEAPPARSGFYRVETDPADVRNALEFRYRLNLLSYDGGDYYFIARRDSDGNIIAYDQEVQIRRIFRLVHVRFNTDVGTNFVTASGFTLSPVTVRMGPAMALWRFNEEQVIIDNKIVAWGRSATLEKILAELRADDRVAFAFPTYIEERGGNPFVGDIQLVVELREGVLISELSDFLAQQGVSAGGRAGPGPPNGPNQYYVFLGNGCAREIRPVDIKSKRRLS